ncbi:Phage integrase family protein [Ruminococcaceae bacterium FB2012]|nr:Phage integrase family protein [Ruminococcaceae bacterium FB2012]
MAQPHKSPTDYIVDKSYNKVAQNFRRFMERKGINITFHQLRHLFATTLNNLGVDDDYIQKMGGWSSNNVLKSVYTHTSAPLEQQFQKLIDDYYLGLIKNSEKQSER